MLRWRRIECPAPASTRRRRSRLATEFYVIASAAWNASLLRLGSPSSEAQYAQAGRNPLVKECPTMWAQIQKVESNWATMPRRANSPPPPPEAVRYGQAISFKKELLWSCASE